MHICTESKNAFENGCTLLWLSRGPLLLSQPFKSCFTFAADVDLYVDKYSMHNHKFLSLSVIVDGAKLLYFNVCIYSTKVELFKLISMCLASEPCGTLLKNFTTSMLIQLATSLSWLLGSRDAPI